MLYMKNIKIFKTALLALFALLFVLWAITADYSGAAFFAAALSCLLFGVVLWGLIARCETVLGIPDVSVQYGPRESAFHIRHPWAKIALYTLLLHALLYALGYAFDLALNGYSGGIFDTLRTLWLRTDSPSYLGIAENWYVTEGDPRFHIVFFPLYPIFIKIFSLFTGSTFAAAMTVSTLCSVGCSIMAYELAALDMHRKRALYLALVLSLLPGNIFLAAPMTEALFLLLSLCCIFFARKRQYLLAGAVGALAAFTRSAGLLLALPIFIEALQEYIEKGRTLSKKDIFIRLGGAAMVVLGTIGYLLINLFVTGNAFTFMVYQQEHWSQSLGAFWNTAAYQTEYLLSAAARGDTALAYTLELPNLLCSFGSLALMAASAKKLRPSYTAYFLIYFAFSIGTSWLLSAPRYLGVCFPLAFAVEELTKNSRILRILAPVLLLVSMLIYLWMYVTGKLVY